MMRPKQPIAIACARASSLGTGPDTVASTGAIKEVLMVLNATGKVGPANRTRDGGYYPQHEEEY